MTEKNDLTERQREVLSFIQTFAFENSYPPSVRDIGEAVGLSSTSSVHAHLNTLEEKGYIRRDGSSARALTVISDDPEYQKAGGPTEIIRSIISLPLIGQVAAGVPIEAQEDIEDTLPLPIQVVGDSASFMLTIRGDSMVEAGIFDGDYVVVREQTTANNGEIVVALIDSEATVKTYYRESDRIRLQPENSSMDPIYARDDVTILGKVIALLRRI
ncbi:MAG: transcriptional repressor LexA [Coriobacteriales bacterium]|jgi:repressor LexA|nr:transcriptional repressor LexA [Coriobacteriales bacterium]